MILWVLLFLLIVAISFILAAKSMRDFAQVPSSKEVSSVFLIRQSSGLTASLVDSIRPALFKHHHIISFERLFKGDKSALVVFGPRKLLLDYKDSLDLLELEDYTNVNAEHVSAWEVGIKEAGGGLFKNLPTLQDTEQLWWQVAFSHPSKPQITAIVVSDDAQNRLRLSKKLQEDLAPDQVGKLPKAYSNTQMLEFYRLRSIRADIKNPFLNSEEILRFLLLSSESKLALL